MLGEPWGCTQGIGEQEPSPGIRELVGEGCGCRWRRCLSKGPGAGRQELGVGLVSEGLEATAGPWGGGGGSDWVSLHLDLCKHWSLGTPCALVGPQVFLHVPQ